MVLDDLLETLGITVFSGIYCLSSHSSIKNNNNSSNYVVLTKYQAMFCMFYTD